MTNEVLEQAKDIVLIRQATDREKWVYAVKPSPVFMKECFEKTLADPVEANIPAFEDKYWRFNDKTGEIEGSSLFLNLRFDKDALRPFGLFLPGFLEARVLDGKRKLSKGVYRDYGVVEYSSGEPNARISEVLAKEAHKKNLELPLLVRFGDLDYKLESDSESGVKVFFVETPQALIYGEDAINVLNQFRWKGNSGARRLLRYGDGDWFASWDGLADSGAIGRVDWVCGEATRADLKSAYDSLSDRENKIRVKELKEKRQKQREAFYSKLEAK